MTCFINILCVVFIVSMTDNLLQCTGFELISRAQWGARASKSVTYLTNLPIYMFVHHSYLPAACSSMAECIPAMQWMQNLHMDQNNWDDIGYSFAIGNDCRVYEGRGWNRVGAHTKDYNSVGLGIVMIGDYSLQLPAECALNTLKELLAYAVTNKKVKPTYTLRGHRDMNAATECPGQALYDLIKTWPHY